MNQEYSTDTVMTILRQIIRAIDLQSKKLTKKYGLTGPQLILLKEIKKNADRPISEIARNVSLSQATVTSILDRLEQRGFAKRTRSDKDKRKVHISLTETAEKILESNPSLLQEEFGEKFEQLEEWERTMIISSLQRMASMMNAENIKLPPVLPAGL